MPILLSWFRKELIAFINLIKPQITLVIVGAGNDAMPVVKNCGIAWVESNGSRRSFQLC